MDGWLQTEKVCTFFCLWTRSVYASQTDRHHFCSHAILLCSFSISHFGPVPFLHPPVGFTFGKITRLLWLVLEKCIGGWIASVQTGGRPPPSPLVLRGGVLVWGGGGSNALVATLSHTHRLSKWFCHHCDCQGTLRLASIALILGLFVWFWAVFLAVARYLGKTENRCWQVVIPVIIRTTQVISNNVRWSQ